MVHFDFEFLLVIATGLTGVIWLIDALFFARSRQQAATSKTLSDPILIEYSKSFFPVLLAVMILRSFLYEPFRIPSGSMMPTLLVGDFILVNKYDYGVRLPVIHNKMTDGEKPKRGDVAVFRYPEDESLDYIKRIIGLPGDHIKYYNRRLTVNGKPVSIAFDHKYMGLGTRENTMNNGGCDKVDAACDVFVEDFDQSGYTVMTNPDVRYTFMVKFSCLKVSISSWVIIETTVTIVVSGDSCQRITWSGRPLWCGCTGIGGKVVVVWIFPE